MNDWRWLAPAGSPMRVVDAARWLQVAATSDAFSTLTSELDARFGVRHAFLASTGRAGLTLLLRALKSLAPDRGDEVVVPTYTCYSVAGSIIKAGLRLRLVDVCHETLDYCPEQLAATDFSRTLAIIATNLYGLPNDIPTLAARARANEVFMIDDAAQAMGATSGGRFSGTGGDAGLFSFDKGKNVSAIDGGVVLTKSDAIAEALQREWHDLPQPAAWQSVPELAKAFGYAVLLRPWLYGIPARIPQLGLGNTSFSTDFPLARPSRALTALAAVMVRSVDRFNEGRAETAARLTRALRDVDGVLPIRPHPGSRSVFLRLPILMTDPAARDRVLTELRPLGVTGSYPASLADVPEVRSHVVNPEATADGGRSVARRIVTLPTHSFVTSRDEAAIVRGLAACQRHGSAAEHDWSLSRVGKGAGR